MLCELRIRNFALIEKAEIRFSSGLNIISGETGAGKSIIIQAISLLLGSRASTDWIQAGKKEATVEGVFDLGSMPWISKRLEQHGFDIEEPELLLKRSVNSQGKNRIWINGELATRAVLQKVCDGLIDLCSQHEHQSLIKSSVQLRLLDQYGGLEPDRKQYSEVFDLHSRKSQALKAFIGDTEGYQQKLDFLRFQIQELETANLEPNEDQKLQEEKAYLKTSHQRLTVAHSIQGLIEGAGLNSEGCLSQVQMASQKLKEMAHSDPEMNRLKDQLDQAQTLLEDVSIDLNRYVQAQDIDEKRLEEVTDRLALIAAFRRKYGESIHEMIDFYQRKKEELQKLENRDQEIEKLQEEIATLKKQLSELGQALSQKRSFVARKLSQNVSRELKDLKMDDTQFKIDVRLIPLLESWTKRGGNDIEYLIQPNAGHGAKPIQKVASGGELSRILLAFRRVISDRGSIGVYLFDEIDTGMGGETAFVVGRKLKSVSKKHQVVCITHLPQVAAYSDHHFVVRKKKVSGMTQTFIDSLNDQKKKEEIARMLGGDEITQSTLRNANELIRSAEK